MLSTFSLTATGLGLAAVAIFVLAYALVILEDVIHLRKSKPVVIAAGLIWILTSIAISQHVKTPDGKEVDVEELVLHHVAEFAQLFLFLMVAMTYISAIAKRNVFAKLNAMLISAGLGYRAVFWATGALAFCISPIADNLTTALLMGAVALTVGRGNAKFISMACINIVVAANAGGAFSPFGDITTLMVWMAKKAEGTQFLLLFVPSLVNWLVPAFVMSLFLPKGQPLSADTEVTLGEGWLTVIVLFIATIATAVVFHVQLHLPPFLGMMFGLGYFMMWGFIRSRMAHHGKDAQKVDIFENVAEVEWDTLLFFFGVIMCVGALGELGYLTLASEWLYGTDGSRATMANVGVGVISAVLDNVPVMLAVIGMDPNMGTGNGAHLYQWLLVTLTAGVGGSMLSVGSAAGVALMGSARGHYTFMSHLKWTPVIALGYAASIAVHWWMNAP